MFLYSYNLSRIAVLERVRGTTTRLVWPPGKGTTRSASAATDDSKICYAMHACLHTIHHHMFVCACPKMSESLARNICHTISRCLLFLVPQLAVNNVDQPDGTCGIGIDQHAKILTVCRHRRTGRISSSSSSSSSVFLRLEVRQHGSIRPFLS